ncbi:hypothetical protein KJA15_03815 [Patescibacteria group bacterium]|nr:hypothetical protein [Patescibacteria group bacterium]
MGENEEIRNKFILAQPLKLLAWEAFLFSLTLGLGIINALRIIQISKEEIQKIPLTPISLLQFIFSFIFVGLIIFLIIKFVKFRPRKGILFKSLFILIVSIGSFFFLGWWIGDFALILILILIFYWLKKPNILIHDFLLISGMVGIGSTFGLRLQPLTVVTLLVIFSIYDIVAVYKTKHMVRMAKEMIKAGAIPGIILPPKISEFQTSLGTVKPGGRFLILGGGDIVFPLLLVASLVPKGILDSLIVAIFATVGLLISFLIFFSQKTRKPIPALPPIALLSIIGYFCTLFL